MHLTHYIKPQLIFRHLTLWFVLLFLSSFSTLSYAKEITVKTDRQTVEMGDVISLIVQVDFQVNNSQLNLNELKEKFDVLTQQQSNQVEIINGKYNSFTRWQIQLLPKELGQLVIPAFEINGIKSKPYPIKVLKAQFTDSNRPYFLEAQVNKRQAYVQEQIIYTLRFYHKGSLINGNIRPPKFDGSLVEQLKEQSVYGKTVNKQQYTVYEWQYAFFPQSSGTMNIPGPSFTGMVQLRGGQKGIRAMAEPIRIRVIPKVQQDIKYWLPADALTLTQEWQNLPKTVHVGDSLKRTITLKVEGLKTSQLPKLTTESGANYKVYPDTNNKKQELSENGVTSYLTLSQAIVPTSEGTLQIPDLTLTWLNTNTNKVETTTLSSEPITIWASNSSIPSVVNQNDESTEEKLNSQSTEDNQAQNAVYNRYPTNDSVQWYWVAIAFVGLTLWLVTLLFLLKTRGQLQDIQTKLKNDNELNQTEKKNLTFDKSWCDLPLNEFYKELLRQLHDDMQIASVTEIDNPVLRKAVLQLESHLFAGEKLGFKTMQEICDNWAALIKRQNSQQKAVKPKKEQQLAELYNQKTN